MDTYTLGDLVEATGAKRRSIQLWADRGVINPLPSTADAGTGVHRQFSRKEAIIACIVQAFALRQISIGELKEIAAHIRVQLRLNPAVEAAVGGAGDTMLSYETWRKNGQNHHQFTIGPGKEIYAPARREENHLCMALRLETYLGKLD